MRRLILLAIALTATLAAPIAQAQQRGTGLIWLEPDRYRSIPLAPPVALSSAPSEFDLSGDFPPPGDQGQQGSCVGWAVGYALKSFQERRERQWTSWDDAKRMSPAFVYNQIKTGGCGDGARIADALGLLSSNGAASWADQPYRENECSSLPTTLSKQNAAMNRIAAWFRVNPQDISVVKAHISAGMPIVIGLGVDRSFRELEGDKPWAGALGAEADGHAMVVVGYSDKKNAVKVMNSWGAGWGEGGFGWIDYEAFKRAVREAYVAQDIVLPVGVAERRDHPYVHQAVAFGPSFVGLQLGMSMAEAKAKANRPFKITTTGEVGYTTTTLAVALEAGVFGGAVFRFDDRYDFLSEIELDFNRYQQAVQVQQLTAALPTISTDLVEASVASKRGKYTDWGPPGGNESFLLAKLPTLRFQDVLVAVELGGPELRDALSRIGLPELIDSAAEPLTLARLTHEYYPKFTLRYMGAPPLKRELGDFIVETQGIVDLKNDSGFARLESIKEKSCGTGTLYPCDPALAYKPSVTAMAVIRLKAAKKTGSIFQ